MQSLLKFLLVLVVGTTLSQAAVAKSVAKRKADIQEMRASVLSELYEIRPQSKELVKDAVGYAVFSNVGVTALFLTAGGGKGIAHDNRTGADTYMKMGTAGVGLGLGIKDFRAVFVFHEEKAFDNFIEKGWDFSGNADASAEIDDIGGDISESASVRRPVTVYQFTENGLSLQITLNGTKYWKDKKLNRASE